MVQLVASYFCAISFHLFVYNFVIKVSRQALYPGHTLGGAQSVHCKPELAGSLECCARCVAKRTLAIGITDCQASQARWWGIGFGVVSAFVLFARLALWSLSRAGDGCDCCCYHFRGYAMDMVVLDCNFAGSRWTW